MRLNNIGLRFGIFALLVSLAAGFPEAPSAADNLYQGSGDDSLTTVSSQAWGRLEYFNRKEYDGGAEKAKDVGPRISVGAARIYTRDDVTFTPRIGAMIGYTNYQGTLGNPYNQDVDTYAKSFGFDLGADLGVVYHLRGEARLEPFLGLGYNWWRNDIASWGGPRETWDTMFVRGGARGSADIKVGDRDIRAYGELGLKRPISTQNTIKLAGHGSADLKQNGDLSAFAEAGIVINQWRFGLAYDSWRFQNSNAKVLPDGTTIVQRKSQADIISLTAGYMF